MWVNRDCNLGSGYSKEVTGIVKDVGGVECGSREEMEVIPGI